MNILALPAVSIAMVSGLAVAVLIILFLIRGFVSSLRQSEHRSRLTLEFGNDGSWDWQVATDALFVSPRLLDLLGYVPGEIPANMNSWMALIHGDDRPRIRQDFRDHFDGLTPRIQHSFRMRNKAGAWIWVRQIAAAVQWVGPRPIRITGIVTDISERRQAEDRLRTLSAAVEQSRSSVIITDAAGTTIFVNHTFSTVTGYSFAEAVGQRPSILKSGKTPAAVYEQMWATITAGQEWRGELLNRKKNGEEFWEDASIIQVRGSDQAIFYVGVKLDVTERKNMEARLLQSRKMEAIGTLAGGIAHDFNNILASILGFNQMILIDKDNPKALTRHVHQVISAGNRAKDLVNQILTFSRRKPSQKTPTDLCPLVEEVCQLIRKTARPDITITLDLPPGKAVVLGSSIQIYQILMNLFRNAVEAIGGQPGTIAIGLARMDREFRLSVKDSGCGISADVQDKIFDPFFTTKGEGTGLGLSVTHGIVEDLGGTIAVETPREGGASFVVRFPEFDPVADDPACPGEDPPAVTVEPLRHILVVDDDLAVVALLRQFLQRLGYRVTGSSDPMAVCSRLKDGERFDVIVTDQFMPGVTGTELARCAAEHSPGTRVLLCTGGTDMVDYDDVGAAPIAGIFLKPFDLADLADTIEALLTCDAAAVD